MKNIRRLLLAALVTVAATSFALLGTASAAQNYELVIKNGRVMDADCKLKAK